MDRVFGGRYGVEAELGRGGYGIVYRAIDQQTGRGVALKALTTAALGGDADRRLEREVQLVQRLSHPNTVRLYDFGRDPDGVPFVAYELLEGETLALVMKQGPMSLERVVRIATQVLRALGEAHALGIIHRDIKPANVMLLQFSGDPDVVKVLDFGIAKLLSESVALTRTGTVVGTPRFMSPEQIRGAGVGPPSDLYSVALLVAEMASGQRVFVGGSHEVFMAQLSEAPVPLPTELEHTPLGAVLQKALAKDSRSRHQTASELASALESLLRQAPDISPTAPTPFEAASRVETAPLRSGRPMGPWIALAAVVAALALATVGGITWYSIRMSQGSAASTAAPAVTPFPTSSGLVEPGPPRVAKLAGFDMNAAKAVFTADGWHVTVGDSDEVVSFAKGRRRAMLTAHSYADEKTAIYVAIESPLGAGVARFGSSVVYVSELGPEVLPAPSRALRDWLVRQLEQRGGSRAPAGANPASPSQRHPPAAGEWLDQGRK